MKNKIIKGITLTLFSTLIIGFVTYRSGFLGGQKSTYSGSPNGSALNNQTDTIPKIDSLKKIEMMSSSKVLILRDFSIQLNDSNKPKSDTPEKINPLIYSSKSGIIFKPTDINKTGSVLIISDSLKK